MLLNHDPIILSIDGCVTDFRIIGNQDDIPDDVQVNTVLDVFANLEISIERRFYLEGHQKFVESASLFFQSENVSLSSQFFHSETFRELIEIVELGMKELWLGKNLSDLEAPSFFFYPWDHVDDDLNDLLTSIYGVNYPDLTFFRSNIRDIGDKFWLVESQKKHAGDQYIQPGMKRTSMNLTSGNLSATTATAFFAAVVPPHILSDEVMSSASQLFVSSGIEAFIQHCNQLRYPFFGEIVI